MLDIFDDIVNNINLRKKFKIILNLIKNNIYKNDLLLNKIENKEIKIISDEKLLDEEHMEKYF